ncbi:cytochrome P450 [Aspergillus crustosus]
MSLSVFLLVAVTQHDATRKTIDELHHVIGPNRLPGFDDLSDLPYLQAYTKEIFRWRPVAPIAMPHLVTEDDEYNGYFIPAKATVVGNQWAMNMDRAVFDDPEIFWPERWIENPDAPVAGFGFGRRVCPGQHIGRDLFVITVARLLWGYEISTPVDVGSIDMSRSALPGMVYKAPVPEIRYRVWSSEHGETIRRAVQGEDLP